MRIFQELQWTGKRSMQVWAIWMQHCTDTELSLTIPKIIASSICERP
jgi:hypothetical protein